MLNYYVSTFKSEFVEGFRRWRGLGGGGGTFWLHKESLTFKGLAA